MPSIEVTEELRNTIRKLRKQKKIVGTTLSKGLGKNTSYVSQLENGKEEEIDIRLFYRLMNEILPNDDTKSQIIDTLLEGLAIKFSNKELEKEIWVQKFDMQFRLIMITDGLINFLKEKTESLKENGITTLDIIQRLNQNIEITELNNSRKKNDIIITYENGAFIQEMMFDLNEHIIDDILDGKVVKISYFQMLGIVVEIYHYLGVDDETSKTKAQKTLYQNKFYTLKEKRKARKNQEDINPYDKEYLIIMSRINSFFNFISDKDTDYTNRKLSVFLNNIEKEPSLSLGILGVDLSKLRTLSKDNKQSFMNDFNNLVLKYIDITTLPVIEKFD